MFLLLTVCSLTLGLATWTTSPAVAIAIIGFSTFIGGGFQMVALQVGSFEFPREQSAMMTGIASGSWSLVNYLLLNVMGAGVTIGSLRALPGLGWLNAQQWGGNLLADRDPAGSCNRLVDGAEPIDANGVASA